MDEFLTVADVAEQLKLNQQTVRNPAEISMPIVPPQRAGTTWLADHIGCPALFRPIPVAADAR